MGVHCARLQNKAHAFLEALIWYFKTILVYNYQQEKLATDSSEI